MILSDKLLNELVKLEENIHFIVEHNNNISDLQVETFLRNLEKQRYNILTQIKLYNKTVEYNTEKIKSISEEYKATVKDNVLKIYIPEPMPTYKNLKTHAFKNILLNLTEITKPFKDMFANSVFIDIKICDNIKGWDVDNKYIKLIPDALISSGVITDDNIEKMFYAVRGEFSKTPHTEVCIYEADSVLEFLKNILV